MKNKSILSISITFIMLITISASSTISVKAACSHGNAVYSHNILSGGVGQYGNFRRYYYIINLNSTYSEYTNNAVSQWVNTTSGVGVTTSISIRSTSTKSSASFEFQNVNLGTGILGRTNFYLYQNTVSPTNSRWGWAKIDLNCSSLANLSATQRQATIAHELGHAMGLEHRNSTPSSIMCQYGSGRTATRGSASDCRNINHLYG